MSIDIYQAIKAQIRVLLDNHKDGIPLATFYELLCCHFAKRLRKDTGWYLFHVKLDLEAKGLIEVIHFKRIRPKVKIVASQKRWSTIL